MCLGAVCLRARAEWMRGQAGAWGDQASGAPGVVPAVSGRTGTGTVVSYIMHTVNQSKHKAMTL